MLARSYLRMTVVCSLTLTMNGCSWFLVSGPPQDHATLDSFSCTESRAAPMLDVVCGGLYLSLAVLNQLMSENINRGVAASFGIGFTAVAGASAYTGFSRVSRCRAALRELDARKTGVPALSVIFEDSTPRGWHPPLLMPDPGADVPQVDSMPAPRGHEH
jgi:hypothetical protein